MDEWKRLRLLVAVDVWSTRVAWSVFAVAFAYAWFSATEGRWGRMAGLLVIALVATLVARWEPALITFDDNDSEES
jgi:hypothetical protein